MRRVGTVVPREIKERIETKIDECINAVEIYFERDFRFPSIEYNLRGTTAGQAHITEWTIKLNSILLMENIDDFIERTVPHEMAHLIDYEMNPENFISRRGQKRSLHGETWKSIMRLMGADPSRCHSYDVSNAKMTKRRQAKHVYVCKTCQTKMLLGAKRHRSMQTGQSRYWMRGCGRHDGYTYIGQEGSERATRRIPVPTTPIPLPTAADAPTRRRGGTSKLDKCRAAYLPGAGRSYNIRLFMNEADCTEAGASTYYSKIKKELG